MKTFNEPHYTKVKEAIIDSVGIAFGGCHKIYILADNDDCNEMLEMDYEVNLIHNVDEAIHQLLHWWNQSCGLQFINKIKNGNLYSVIEQFEEI